MRVESQRLNQQTVTCYTRSGNEIDKITYMRILSRGLTLPLFLTFLHPPLSSTTSTSSSHSFYRHYTPPPQLAAKSSRTNGTNTSSLHPPYCTLRKHNMHPPRAPNLPADMDLPTGQSHHTSLLQDTSPRPRHHRVPSPHGRGGHHIQHPEILQQWAGLRERDQRLKFLSSGAVPALAALFNVCHVLLQRQF